MGDRNGADPSNAALTPAVGNKGNVLWVQDAGYAVSGSPSNGKQFTYTYNSNGQKASETNLNGVTTAYIYGGATDWSIAGYGAVGNLTQTVQDPPPTPSDGKSHLNRTTLLSYDVAGHVLQSVDPNSNTDIFAYNNLGQPETANLPAKGTIPAETIQYSYGGNGRTQSVADGRGTTTLTYETGCDRVQSVTDPVTGPISYTYAINGERLSMTLPGGGTWTYDYTPTATSDGELLPNADPNSLSMRLVGITDDQGRRVDVALAEDGSPEAVRTNETYTTGSNPTLVSYQEADYSYLQIPNSPTAKPLVTEVKTTWNSQNSQGAWQQSVLVQNDYTYDNAGLRLTNTVSATGLASRTETYGYDVYNHLSSVNYGDGETQGYTFDAMGNRLTKTDNVTGNEGYICDSANMLTSRTVGGTSNTYANDANGNTLNGGGRTSTWDSQNRMVSCSYNGNTSSYIYGSDGIRRQATVNGVTTHFVTDNSMFVREMRGGVNYATYLMGARGPEYRRDDVAGTVRWYLYDGLGSVQGEADPNGNVTASRKFDVYGVVRSSTGTSTSKHKFVGKLGHPSDDESGLIYMEARYVDPAVGRFTSQDPKGHGTNWFQYCSSDPINRVDSNGDADDYEFNEWTIMFNQARTEWRFALAEAPQFRMVALAFLGMWFAMVSAEEFGGSGNALDSALRVEGLACDYNEFRNTTPRSGLSLGEQVTAFYSGWAAGEEITYCLLFRDDLTGD